VQAIVEGDADAIRGLTTKFPTQCAANWCPAGVDAGTRISIIRAVSCEPLLPNDMPGGTDGTIEWFSRSSRTLVAVYVEAETRPYLDWVPRGDYVVVVWTASTEIASRGSAFHIKAGQIVGIEFGCSQKPESYYTNIPASSFIVGPLPY